MQADQPITGRNRCFVDEKCNTDQETLWPKERIEYADDQARGRNQPHRHIHPEMNNLGPKLLHGMCVFRQGRGLHARHVEKPRPKQDQKECCKNHLKPQKRAIGQLADVIHLFVNPLGRDRDKAPVEEFAQNAMMHHWRRCSRLLHTTSPCFADIHHPNLGHDETEYNPTH